MAKRTIYRGTEKTWMMQVPVGSWTSGDHIIFGAKRTLDQDPSDAKAVLKKSFSDESIIETDDTYKHFGLMFTEVETRAAPVGTYLAEFKYVTAGNKPIIYPAFELDIKQPVNNRDA